MDFFSTERYRGEQGRGTQVVRERSAKPLCVGSIPTRASNIFVIWRQPLDLIVPAFALVCFKRATRKSSTGQVDCRNTSLKICGGSRKRWDRALRAPVEVLLNCVIPAGAQGMTKWASGTVEYPPCAASA